MRGGVDTAEDRLDSVLLLTKVVGVTLFLDRVAVLLSLVLVGATTVSTAVLVLTVLAVARLLILVGSGCGAASSVLGLEEEVDPFLVVALDGDRDREVAVSDALRVVALGASRDRELEGEVSVRGLSDELAGARDLVDETGSFLEREEVVTGSLDLVRGGSELLSPSLERVGAESESLDLVEVGSESLDLDDVRVESLPLEEDLEGSFSSSGYRV